MKIAILSFYSGLNKRGVERWTYELASRFTNFDVFVFQNFKPDNNVNYNVVQINVNYNEAKKEVISSFQKLAFLNYKSRKILLFTLKLLPRLWKGNFDVVIPTDGGWEPAIIRILTWIKRMKMVIVGHAGIGWDDRNNLWSFPDCFVALSSYAKKWAEKVNPFVKSVYIPDGVDIEKFSPHGKKAKISLTKPIVLTVGALEKNKRIDLVIKAVAKMKNASLLVVGRGEEKEEISELGRKLLDKRFLLEEFDFSKMPEVYRACDLFTSASLPYFSFEMVIPEAMASGLPVVVNDDPIRKEIVGDAGILENPENTLDFARALEKGLNKNWRGEMRKQAERFSWDKIVAKYEELFEGLVR